LKEKEKDMKSVMQILAAPLGVLALVATMAFGSAIESGAVPFSVGLTVGGLILAAEIVIFKNKEEEDGHEEED
jgi:Ni/Fe-hydrogenase subunit HybB-like protein